MLYWKISAKEVKIVSASRELYISVYEKPMYISQSVITNRMKANFTKNNLEVSIDTI